MTTEKKFDITKFLNVVQKNLWSDFRESKQRIYVKVNWWFEKNHAWIEFIIALLIFQIKNNVSDLHIEALNSIAWRIRYRKNKLLEIMRYSELKPVLFEVIDYFFENESDTFRNTKKELYDEMLTQLDQIYFIYWKDQIFIDKYLQEITEEEKEVLKNTSEKKIKIWFIQMLNEAFQVLFKFNDWIKNQNSWISIWYWEIEKQVMEYSFRIEWKKQDLQIEWKAFFSIVSRLMFSKDYTLDQLWIWEYKNFITEKLLSKSLNVIWWETNSWKSTTNISMLRALNQALDNKVKIISIEKPIEKQVDYISQTQIRDIPWWSIYENFNFDDFERYVLRSDPDGILVWEINDKNTATIALKLALSWHYTYATLHIWTALWVVPRFQWWWIDMKSNITALWFVEITQLVTTYSNAWYKDEDSIVWKIKNWVLKLKDLKDIPYKYYQEYLQEKRTWIESNTLNKDLREIFQYMQWRSFLIDFYEYYHTKDLNKLFSIEEYYEKYIYYLSTYFSNRYVDWLEFVWKKKIILDFLKIVWKCYTTQWSIKKLLFETKKKNLEEIKEFYNLIFKSISEFNKKEDWKYEDEIEFLKNKENMWLIFKLLWWKYENELWYKVPFFFIDFFDFLWETWYLPFKSKSTWMVPIIEIFDYSDNYKIILKKDEEWLLYRTKVFTPMFLYWLLNVNQKQNQAWKIIDLHSIISMFSSEYNLD